MSGSALRRWLAGSARPGAALCGALGCLLALAGPAQAGPGGTPSPSTPAVSFGAGLPGQPDAQPAPPNLGPLAAQLATASQAVEALGEQLKKADENLATLEATRDAARRAWQDAQDRLDRAQRKAESAAADAYKQGVQLGPFDSLAGQLHQWGLVAPGIGDQPGGQGVAREAQQAQAAERAAYQVFQTADTLASSLASQRDSLKATFDQQSAALAALRASNANAIAAIDAQFNAYQASLGGTGLSMIGADGSTANAKALAAVKFALSQLGKRYVWGTEGPNTYDCSGLVWAAYRSVGTTLPRVANDQYHGTTPVPVSRKVRGDLLLPGDLLFFATNPRDWVSIHHVAMYIGGGWMVHAPNSGDIVKISPVWWSEFFGATRIFPPVRGAGAGAAGNPGGATTPQVVPSPTMAPPIATTTPAPSPAPPATSTPTPAPAPTTQPPSGTSGAPTTTDPAASKPDSACTSATTSTTTPTSSLPPSPSPSVTSC